jgi:hypothetical protein
MIRTPIVCAAALAMTASITLAEDASIIRGYEHRIEVKRVEHRIYTNNTRRLVKVVTHEVDDRIVTLNKAKALAGMDNSDASIHVEYVHENVYLDPNEEYLRQHDNSFDAKALIPTAHRIGRDLRANKASIVFGSPEMVPMQEVTARPLMIIERPEGTPKRAIPSVPTPPQKREKPMVVMAK